MAPVRLWNTYINYTLQKTSLNIWFLQIKWWFARQKLLLAQPSRGGFWTRPAVMWKIAEPYFTCGARLWFWMQWSPRHTLRCVLRSASVYRFVIQRCYSVKRNKQSMLAGHTLNNTSIKVPSYGFIISTTPVNPVLTAQQYRSSHAAAFQQPCLFLIYIVHCLE